MHPGSSPVFPEGLFVSKCREMYKKREVGHKPSYHHIVVDVPQVKDVHGALRSSSVAPWGAGGGHWALTWLASRGQLKVGTVWFPVYAPDEKGLLDSSEWVSSTGSENPPLQMIRTHTDSVMAQFDVAT